MESLAVALLLPYRRVGRTAYNFSEIRMVRTTRESFPCQTGRLKIQRRVCVRYVQTSVRACKRARVRTWKGETGWFDPTPKPEATSCQKSGTHEVEATNVVNEIYL